MFAPPQAAAKGDNNGQTPWPPGSLGHMELHLEKIWLEWARLGTPILRVKQDPWDTHSSCLACAREGQGEGQLGKLARCCCHN